MRKWSAKEKAKIVLEVLSGQRTVAEACRAHEVAESVLYRWQREFLDNAHAAFSHSCAEQEARVRELERLAGQLALELEVLKKPRTLPAKERRELVMALKETYPLRLLCRALGVPRSTLYYRPKGPPPDEAVLRGRLRGPGPGMDTGASPLSCGGRASGWGRSGCAP
jgi:putative transposase